MNANAIVVLAVMGLVSSQKPSPCPGVLKYEKRTEDDRWSAVLSLASAVELDGIWVHVDLDRTADILVNNFGHSTTASNKEFLIKNEDYQLSAGKPLKIKFIVKYDPLKNVPSVKKVRLNGGVICGGGTGDLVLTEATTLPTTTQLPLRPKQQAPIPIEAPRIKLVEPELRFSEETACGIVTATGRPLVYYGSDAEEGQWPWHVAIYLIDGEQKYSCGGTLISENYVITASHCVTRLRTRIILDAQRFLLYLGTHRLDAPSVGLQVLQAKEITIHPNYHPSRYYNDVALMKLTRPAQITDYVRPVCLWEGDEDLHKLVSKAGTVLGFGVSNNNDTSNKLVEATMAVVSLETCLFSDRAFYSQFTTEKTYCAGNRNATTVCRGDSGGGMVFRRKGSTEKLPIWQLRGLVSVSPNPGQRACDTKNYVIFTDLAKHLDWIKTTAKIK